MCVQVIGELLVSPEYDLYTHIYVYTYTFLCVYKSFVDVHLGSRRVSILSQIPCIYVCLLQFRISDLGLSYMLVGFRGICSCNSEHSTYFGMHVLTYVGVRSSLPAAECGPGEGC